MTFSRSRAARCYRAAIVAATSVAALVGAHATAPAAKTPARVYVVDCFGDLVSIDAASPKVLAHRALAELLPPVPPTPVICLLNAPHWEEGQLAFDMSAGGEFDEDEQHHRDVRIDLSTDRVTRLSDERPAPPIVSAGPVLDELAAGNTPTGQALAPFATTDGHGVASVAADEAARTGHFVLMQLVRGRPDATAFAVVDLQTRVARVVANAPPAHLSQMHLSQTGRSVLIEVSATPVAPRTRSVLRRSGRLIQIDVDTGRITHDRVLPMLAADGKDPRVLCFSDDGQIVIGAKNTNHVWLVQGARTIQLDVPNDLTTSCFFSDKAD